MTIEIVGKEIEKIKGDFESYLNGLNMVGEISYSQYSELYDEGTKQIQKAYELGKSELEKENAELKKKVENLQKYLDTRNCYRECAETWLKLTEAKKLLKQFLEAKNGEDTYKAEWEAEQFLKEEPQSKWVNPVRTTNDNQIKLSEVEK